MQIAHSASSDAVWRSDAATVQGANPTAHAGVTNLALIKDRKIVLE